MMAAFGLILLMALKKHLAQFNSMNSYLHGSARWAQKQDIARAGLLPRSALNTGEVDRAGRHGAAEFIWGVCGRLAG